MPLNIEALNLLSEGLSGPTAFLLKLCELLKIFCVPTCTYCYSYNEWVEFTPHNLPPFTILRHVRPPLQFPTSHASVSRTH